MLDISQKCNRRKNAVAHSSRGYHLNGAFKKYCRLALFGVPVIRYSRDEFRLSDIVDKDGFYYCDEGRKLDEFGYFMFDGYDFQWFIRDDEGPMYFKHLETDAAAINVRMLLPYFDTKEDADPTLLQYCDGGGLFICEGYICRFTLPGEKAPYNPDEKPEVIKIKSLDGIEYTVFEYNNDRSEPSNFLL